MKTGIIVLATCIGLGTLSCGSTSNSHGTPAPNNENQTIAETNDQLDFGKIPKEFNPESEVFAVAELRANKIKVRLPAAHDGLVLKYVDQMKKDAIVFRQYRVWKDSASFLSIGPKIEGVTLEIAGTGTYTCSMRVQNNQLTELNGGCYVRYELELAKGAELEVYYGDKLLTKRFVPISVEEFLSALKKEGFGKNGLTIIDEFVSSYVNVSKVPALLCFELEEVLEVFDLSTENKLEALKRLHQYVSNKADLGKTLDGAFPFSSQREKARQITGY